MKEKIISEPATSEDIVQVIVLKNGVETINVSSAQAIILGISEPAEEEGRMSGTCFVYGDSGELVDLSKETMKRVLLTIMGDVPKQELQEDDDDCSECSYNSSKKYTS